MDAAIEEDVAKVNSEVLLLASDPEEGESTLRLLGAQPNVIARIASAGAKGVGTAIRCGVPLVVFVPKLEELLAMRVADVHEANAQQVPPAIKELTRLTLQVAQRAALIDRTLAQLHFGFTGRSLDGLIGLSMTRLLRLADRHGVLIRLRASDKTRLWDRLLIGDRSPGPRGYRFSHQTALACCRTE